MIVIQAYLSSFIFGCFYLNYDLVPLFVLIVSSPFFSFHFVLASSFSNMNFSIFLFGWVNLSLFFRLENEFGGLNVTFFLRAYAIFHVFPFLPPLPSLFALAFIISLQTTKKKKKSNRFLISFSGFLLVHTASIRHVMTIAVLMKCHTTGTHTHEPNSMPCK